jgi:ribonuclease HII
VAISCHVGSVKEIDDIGINLSTFKTMRKCLADLPITLEHILIDGTEWDKEENTVPYTLVPKGDDTYTCIAAAAIVAKVRRDEYMCKLHLLHPQYKWDKNKGYLTPEHIKLLKELGPTRYHREKFIRNFIK